MTSPPGDPTDRHQPACAANRHTPHDESLLGEQPLEPEGFPSTGLLDLLPRDHTSLEQTSDEFLIQQFRAFEHTRRALDAATAAVIDELDARGVPDRQFGHRTKTWIAVECDLPGREAARELKIARLLRSCPLLREALEEGRISSHHVYAIAKATNQRNLEIVISIQEELVSLVDSFTRFEAWEAQVRDLLNLVDQDGGHDPRPEQNHLSLSHGLDGELHIKGTFVGQWALTVKDTLERLTDSEFRKHNNDAEATNGELPLPTRGTLMALAFVEACRNGAVATAASSRGPVADINLVIRSDAPDLTSTLDGRQVDPSVADLLRCDPVLHPMVVNSLGVPTHLGRAVRLATPAQRRALAIRDGGCVFPGCDSPPGWTDAHHVKHWEIGGTTDLPELASLCRHHHGVVHRNGWSMRSTSDQRFLITTPQGQVLASQRHHRQDHSTDGTPLPETG